MFSLFEPARIGRMLSHRFSLIRWSVFTFLVCAVLAAPVCAQKPSPDDLLVLNNVSVIDVRTGTILPDQTVVLAKNKIDSVGPSKAAKYSRRAATVNCRGMFLIPGLWDMHVHLMFGDWFPGSREIVLPLLVANGVTGVRDMGSELDVVQSWRDEIEGGRLVGPRIFTSGPMLDGPKPRFPSSVAISTPDDGRRAVDDLQRRGADFIKLQSLIPRDAVFAIAEQAKKQQIPFEGHVPDAMRASEMSKAGMKSFEHLIGILEGSSPDEDEFLKGNKTVTRLLASYDPVRASSLAAMLAKNQTWQCPTLVWERGGNLLDQTDFAADSRAKYAPSSWKNGAWKRFTTEIRQGYTADDIATRKKFVQKELELVQLLHKAGVPFLAGTDTPPGVYIFPGFSLHEELQRFVDAGFTSLEALQTATLNPARFFGMESQLGTIEPGKLADLVLLSANPLENIANTQKIVGVVANGQYFYRAQLDKMLNGVEAAAHRRK
jgi:imidazolonepropionase-like amidohydrolase